MTYDETLQIVDHRPYPLPGGMWRMRQRWNDLLFAHWPVPAELIARLLPAGLIVDSYDGFAWVGIVPFWMDEVQVRVVGQKTAWFPTTRTFAELNVRTYVRSPKTGLAGVYFFSLDCESLLAVIGARVLFHLPYFYAAMRRVTTGASVEYESRRLLAGTRVKFEGGYRTLGVPAPAEKGSLEAFLTERYCLFTTFRGRVLRGDIHHAPWPLERAEAEFRTNELAAAHGISLPDRVPVLHFSRELRVTIWGLREE